MTTLPIEPEVFWGVIWVGGLLFAILLIFGAFPEGTHHTVPLERFQQRLNLDKINPGIFLIALILWGLLFGLLFISIISLIWDFLWLQAPRNTDERIDWRFTLVKLTATTAVLGAVVAFPITVMKASYNRRQIETQEKGQVTDRFTKAIEGLGADKVIFKDGEQHTAPNIEVRVGAILALEKIAFETPTEREHTLETLSVYVRENISVKVATPDIDASEGYLEEYDRWKLPRSDVRAAMRSLSQLAKIEGLKDSHVDLRTSSFKNLALSSLDCSVFDLRMCDFTDALITDCDLSDASFVGSYFSNTTISNSNLNRANFSDIAFGETTSFKQSSLKGTLFQNCDLSQTSLTQNQLDLTYGDRSVKLPDHLRAPKHWNNRVLSYKQGQSRRQKFIEYKGYKREKESA